MNNVQLLFPEYFCYFQNLPLDNEELQKHLEQIEYKKTYQSRGCYTSLEYNFIQTLELNYEKVFNEYILTHNDMVRQKASEASMKINDAEVVLDAEEFINVDA